jgi:hypothetical protein
MRLINAGTKRREGRNNYPNLKMLFPALLPYSSKLRNQELRRTWKSHPSFHYSIVLEGQGENYTALLASAAW